MARVRRAILSNNFAVSLYEKEKTKEKLRKYSYNLLRNKVEKMYKEYMENRKDYVKGKTDK